MDQSLQSTQPVMGIVPGISEIAYPAPAHASPMATGAPPGTGAMPSSAHLSSAAPLFTAPQQHLSYQHIQQYHHQQQQQQQQQLQAFWSDQMLEIEQTMDFKNHSLPLARIKKIMKADEDVRMISAEAPVVFAKACEMFILELALRSWINTEENKRRTLQKNDIAAAITRTDIFDFLVDIIPRDELKEDGLGIPRAALPGMGSLGSSVDSLPYYYMPAQPQLPPGPGMIAGKPVEQMEASGYGSAPHSMAYVWPQPSVQSTQQQVPDGG